MAVIHRDRILNMVKSLLLTALKNTEAKVYLFGSWARREERQSSDIDIAIECRAAQAKEVVSSIKSLLEESTIPYNVDVVDLTTADEAIVKQFYYYKWLMTAI